MTAGIRFSKDPIGGYTNKQDVEREFGLICSRFVNVNGTVEEYLSLPLQGTNTSPSTFKTGKPVTADWQSACSLVIDMDNAKENVPQMSPSEAFDLCTELGIVPNLMYATFSDSPERRKFRIVWMLPYEIVHGNLFLALHRMLGVLFPQADENCFTLHRQYIGGKEELYKNVDNRLNIPLLFRILAGYFKGKNAKRDAINFWETSGLLVTKEGLPGFVARNIQDELSSFIEEENPAAPSLLKTNPIPISISLGMSSSHKNDNPAVYYTGAGEVHEFYVNPHKTITTQRGQERQPKGERVAVGTIPTIRGANWNKLYEDCIVYRNFMDGVEFPGDYNLTFAIVSNLLLIEGGEARFWEGIRKQQSFNEAKRIKWETHIYGQKNSGTILPIRYDSHEIAAFYPDLKTEYASIYTYFLGRRIVSGVRRVAERAARVSLGDARLKLSQTVDTILKDPRPGVYVVKAPTGIGKTTAIREMAKNRAILDASDRHDLNAEKARDYHAAGIDVAVTPPLPELPSALEHMVNRLYAVGAHSNAAKAIRNKAATYEPLADYIEQLDTAVRTNGTLLTTHARALFLRTRHDVIVFDEDPFDTIFPTGKVTIAELRVLREALRPKGFQPTSPSRGRPRRKFGQEADLVIIESLIKELEEKNEGLPFALPPLPFQDFQNVADKIVELNQSKLRAEQRITGPLIEFLQFATFGTRYGDTIDFVQNRTKSMPYTTKKIIIFSATVSEPMYRAAFGEYLRFFELPPIVPQGKIVQTTMNASRSALENQNVVEIINNRATGEHVITFKNAADKFENTAMTFGATTGLNSLAGKSIDVVGTFYLPTHVYALKASALGYRVSGDDLSSYRYQPVNRKGLTYSMMTFTNEFLREIQLNTIEAHLVQAVGRSRLNEHNVVVQVFSEYPLEDADVYEQLTKTEQQYIRIGKAQLVEAA